MNHFEIPPLGMTPDDLQAVGLALDDLARNGQDCVMHYWSKERRVLLLVQHEAGQVFDWMLMPCAAVERVPGLLGWWLEQVAEDVREREETAKSTAGAEVDRVKDTRHPTPTQWAVLGLLGGQAAGMAKTAMVEALRAQGIHRASVGSAIEGLLLVGLVTEQMGVLYPAKNHS